MLRQTIKIGAVLLAIGGVFVYAVVHRELGRLQLRQIAPPIGEAFDHVLDVRDVLPDLDFDVPVIGQRDVDAVVDPSHV